jgi:hypothetical protein
MRTTVNLDDELLALVQRESACRLAKLGGTEPQLQPIPRRLIAEAGMSPRASETFWLTSTCRHATHAPKLSPKRIGFEIFRHRLG